MRVCSFKPFRKEVDFDIFNMSTSYLKITNGVVRLEECLNAKPLVAEVEDASAELYAFVVDENVFFSMSLLTAVFPQFVLVFSSALISSMTFSCQDCSRERLFCALTCSSRQPR